jgi:O-antigen/teichoic acid export membrane protein
MIILRRALDGAAIGIWHSSLLESTENVVKRSFRKVAELADTHRGFIALCDQGVMSVTNFVTAMIIGRVCGKAELGIYTLAWSLLSIVNGISATVITTPCIVLSPQFAPARRRRYLASLFVHQALLAAIFTAGTAAVVGLTAWGGWISGDLSRATSTVAAIIFFTSLREFVRSVCFAELRTHWAFAVDVIACAFQLTGMALLFYSQALTVSRTFLLLGIGCAVASAIWLVLNHKRFRFNARLVSLDLKKNWAFAKWVLGSAVAWQVATYLYPWMLTAFHGTAATGDWAACAAIVAAGNPIFLGLNNYVAPKIANVYAESGLLDMNRYIQRSSLIFAVLLLPLVVLLAAFGSTMVTGIYGKSYTGATLVIVFLSSNMLVNSLTNPFAQGLFNLKHAKADMLVNIVSVALLFTIGIPIVRAYAATGAAFALLASSTIVAIIKIGIFRREVVRRSHAVVSNASS